MYIQTCMKEFEEKNIAEDSKICTVVITFFFFFWYNRQQWGICLHVTTPLLPSFNRSMTHIIHTWTKYI